MTRACVIGGGIAGLATATLLARDGHEVRVLERGSRPGGRAGVIRRDGFTFDTGPSWYLMPRVFDHFFALAGTSTDAELDLVRLDPGYRVFSEPATGRNPVTIPAGREAVQTAFDTLEPGSSAVLDAYLDSAHRATLLAENHFLYNPFKRLTTLLNRDVLGATRELTTFLTSSLADYVAERFTHPVLRKILGYPAVFLGTNPADAPAMYHLMSALDLDEGVQYPMGGFWGVVERLESLARRSGVTLVTGADVREIVTHKSPSRRGRPFTVSGVRWRDKTGTEYRESADMVVSAADLHHTETELLTAAARTYPEAWWEKRVSGPGAVIAMLGVRGKLPELPHHSLFFVEDWGANFRDIFGKDSRVPEPASIYVCKPSETDAGVAPHGHENLFVLIPVPADPTIGRGGSEGDGDPRVEATVDRVIDQISEWAGIPDLRTRVVLRETLGPRDFFDDYRSWKGGMLGPAHVLRQSAMFRAQNASRKVEGLFYAGGTTAPGVGVPMCLISAELVLKHTRGDYRSGPVEVP